MALVGRDGVRVCGESGDRSPRPQRVLYASSSGGYPGGKMAGGRAGANGEARHETKSARGAATAAAAPAARGSRPTYVTE